MSLKIKCPSCQKEFVAGEELRGKKVECGVCEHQFQVNEDVLDHKRKRYYPGEKQEAHLEQFAKSFSTMPGQAQAVNFQTAQYKGDNIKAEVAMPMPPRRMLAILIGLVTLCGSVLLAYTGSKEGGFLTDVSLDKRFVLFGFIACVGMGLISYGFWKKARARGVLLALLFGGILMGAVARFPVYTTPSTQEMREHSKASELEEEQTLGELKKNSTNKNEQKTVTNGLKEKIGYDPVQKALLRSEASPTGPYPVIGVVVFDMSESSKFMIVNYLSRVSGVSDRPACYERVLVGEQGEAIDAGIFVLEDYDLELLELKALCENFGTVDEELSDPESHLLVVHLDVDNFKGVSSDLQERMSDPSDPAFYELNYKELASIDLMRVEKAASRFSRAKPELHRKKIAYRLVNLLPESQANKEFEKNICLALQRFLEKGDGLEEKIMKEANHQMDLKGTISRSLLELLIVINASSSERFAEVMWRGNPLSWEPSVALLEKRNVPMLLRGLQSGESMIQKSAARLLRLSGSSAQLPALRLALSSADSGVQSEIKATIEALKKK